MRLIDVDALMQSLGITNMDCDKCAWHDNESCTCKRGGAFVDACCAIEDAPTIDAVPVRHGEWYGEADGYADGELVYDIWYCPFCGKRFEEWDEKPNWNYCPNCGADMRENNS